MSEVDVLEIPERAAVDGRGRPARPPRGWLIAHLVLLAAAAVVLVVANRGQWFFGDEWEFFVNRGIVGARTSIWAPHNEHWSTIPIVVYTLVRAIFGMGSYWPYIGVLIAVHLTLVHLLWRIALRVGGSALLVTVGAALFSVFGAGAENLLWAFQIGFIGSLAFGWAAILVADSPRRDLRRRDAVATLLLVCSLMCAGIGIPMVVAAVTAIVLRTRHLLRAAVVGGVPALVFAVWYVAVGRDSAHPTYNTGTGLGELLLQARAGIVSVAHDSLGSALLITKILLVCGGLAFAWAVVGAVRGGREYRDAAAAIGGVVGLFAFVGMISLSRTVLGSSRYAYIEAALLLPAVVWGLSAVARRQWVHPVVLAAVLVLVGLHNYRLLFTMADNNAVRAAWVRATVTAAANEAEADPTLHGQPEPIFDPDITMASLREMVAHHGLPTEPVTPAAINGVLLGLDLAVQPGGAASADATRGALEPTRDVAVSADPAGSGGECWATAGPQPQVIVRGGAATLTFTSGVGGVYTLYVGAGAELSHGRDIVAAPGVPTVLVSTLPEGVPLQVDLPPGGGVLCTP